MEDIKILEDRVTTSDELQEITADVRDAKHHTTAARKISHSGNKFYTEIMAYDEYGNSKWDAPKHNELLLPGGLFTLAKIAGVTPPIKPLNVNDDLGINANEADPGFEGFRREDTICGFIVGLDGCTDVFDTVNKVNYSERTIKSKVPFRRILAGEELTEAEKKMYFLKKEESEYVDFYAKHFEVPPTIVVEYDEAGNPTVPANADEVSGDRLIKTYVQFTLHFTKKDLREWFKTAGGGLKKARFNALSLVHGYYDGVSDYKGVTCFSKLNMNNEPFDNEEREMTYIYKIFI